MVFIIGNILIGGGPGSLASPWLRLWCKLLQQAVPEAGLEVDAVQKQRRIDIDNSHKKQTIVNSPYQKQKAKTIKKTKSKDIKNKKQRLVIDVEMRRKNFNLFFIRLHEIICCIDH